MTDPLFAISITTPEDHKMLYLTKNWKMVLRDGEDAATPQLVLVGEFVDPYTHPNTQIWLKELKTNSFSVDLVTDQATQALYRAAEDLQRLQHWQEAVTGLAERFFDSNLPNEVREILKRSPASVDAVGKMVGDGIGALLKRFKK